MKKLLYIIPALALTLSVQSCKDDDFTKHSIDAQYETGTTTTTAAAAAPAVIDYQSATISATVSSVADIVEQGVMVSTSPDFSDPTYFANTGDLATSYTVVVDGLEGSTTYYARSYAITTNGGYVYGDSQTFTTPRTPIFTIDGVYTVTEYTTNDDYEWEVELYEDEPVIYEIGIEFAEEGNETDVKIFNLGDLSKYVGMDGSYDSETGIVEIPSMQVVASHPKYGPMFFRGLKEDFSGYTPTFQFSFKTLGGELVSSPFALCVEAGYFGFYRIAGTHNEIEEE